MIRRHGLAQEVEKSVKERSSKKEEAIQRMRE
jgi:hypothetical protein